MNKFRFIVSISLVAIASLTAIGIGAYELISTGNINVGLLSILIGLAVTGVGSISTFKMNNQQPPVNPPSNQGGK